MTKEARMGANVCTAEIQSSASLYNACPAGVGATSGYGGQKAKQPVVPQVFEYFY